MAVKILSVDDELDLEVLLTQYFRRKIRKGEYEFFFAHNGLEALQVLLKNPDIEIILSDINMPEMDGLTLLNKINEMRNPMQKCIMVSAYGDLGNIRQAMNNGAFDFATKPIDLDDLQITIDKAIDQLNYIRSSEKEHKQLTDLQSELSVAREIQQSILPLNFTPSTKYAGSVDIFASMTAAKDVGGDFYDFFMIDENHMGFTMADVSGKGVPAALFMAVSRTLIKMSGISGLSAEDCMEQSNKLLCEENPNTLFVTVFYGIMDLTNGQVHYVNAGHNHPYILRADGSVEAVKGTMNLVLGIMDGVKFKGNDLTLQPGDALIMYTDGVTEAEDKDYNQFGEPRLENTLADLKDTNSQTIVQTVNAKVREFANGATQNDDITQLVIKRI